MSVSSNSDRVDPNRDLILLEHLEQNPDAYLRPSRGWIALNLSALWAYRELVYFLTWRDIKVRYKQAALGIAWAIIQPVVSMVIFTLIFGRLAGLLDR
jgi:lipopolysaccharide transport system permease protein